MFVVVFVLSQLTSVSYLSMQTVLLSQTCPGKSVAGGGCGFTLELSVGRAGAAACGCRAELHAGSWLVLPGISKVGSRVERKKRG